MGTASWRDNGTLYGLNLTRNQAISPQVFNENCIWIGEKVYRLPYVEFTHLKNPDKWIIQSADKSVDLEFHPAKENSIKVNLGLIEVDYQAPYGRFGGTINLLDFELKIDGAFGMGEIKRYRM